MGPWYCRMKPDLRLKTVENCWREDQYQVQVVMGTLMANSFRGREFSKKIKAFSSHQDLSCWLTPESAHAPDTLAAWWVQLCQGTRSTAWDSSTHWEVSGTQELLYKCAVVFECMCESSAVIHFTDSPTRNISGNCRFQPDGPGSRSVSAADQQPGEDLDSSGEVKRNLDCDGSHLPDDTACKGQGEHHIGRKNNGEDKVVRRWARGYIKREKRKTKERKKNVWIQ